MHNEMHQREGVRGGRGSRKFNSGSSEPNSSRRCLSNYYIRKPAYADILSIYQLNMRGQVNRLAPPSVHRRRKQLLQFRSCTGHYLLSGKRRENDYREGV